MDSRCVFVSACRHCHSKHLLLAPPPNTSNTQSDGKIDATRLQVAASRCCALAFTVRIGSWPICSETIGAWNADALFWRVQPPSILAPCEVARGRR